MPEAETTPGEAIRDYRSAQKPPMSQEKLAALVDTTEPNLSRIENDKQPVSDDLLPKFVKLGIPARLLRPDLAKLFEPRPQKRAARRKAA